ncbi:MAG: hypothetical protein U5L09_03230 [Bacteroidales bacterium]|nr:hypothetical protein [Bacteroidales bacterium]
MLQTVANGLSDLKDDMVFIGGAVAELYASNPELSDIRPTLDVDCVIELRSKTAHAKLEPKLSDSRSRQRNWTAFTVTYSVKDKPTEFLESG